MTSLPPPESIPDALRRALARVKAGHVLDEDEARLAFDEILLGDTPHTAIGELLLALGARGEAASELAGVVAALRGAMLRVPFDSPSLLVDTCGTGGGTCAHSTCRLPRRSWLPEPGCPSPSTAIAASRPGPVRPMYLRRSGSTSDVGPDPGGRDPQATSGSSFCSRRTITRPCAMWRQSGVNLGFPPS